MSTDAGHPEIERMRLFVREALAAKEYRSIEEHVQRCQRCQDVLESLTVSLPPDMLPAQARPAPSPVSTTVTIPPPMDSNRPRLPDIGNYEVLKKIGQGGMGVVYLGRKSAAAVEFRVAVKTILASHFASSEAVELFLDEIRRLERIQHGNIVPIIDCGMGDDGRPYYVMPLARCSLADILRDHGSLEPKVAAECIRAIAGAVRYLHDKKIVHRDLKPSNILIDDAGRYWVADFGLAKLLTSSAPQPSTDIQGTYPYMSPQQIKGEELMSRWAGRRSDVWSLGIILFELLTGRRPFEGKQRADVANQILNQEPPLPRRFRADIPRDLQRIALKCLEKSPADRYRSVSRLIVDLDCYLQGKPLIHARPTNCWERLERWSRREPALATRIGVAAGCSAIMWFYASIFGDTPRPSGGQWVERFPHLDRRSLRLLNQFVFVVWIFVSLSCQRLSERRTWMGWARRAWLTADLAVLASLIFINDGLMSPMPVAFAVLVGASGLWFHVPTVVYTTATAIAAYVALLCIDGFANRGGFVGVHKYHCYTVLALAVLGAIVVYQARRVQTLNQLYEQKPRL